MGRLRLSRLHRREGDDVWKGQGQTVAANRFMAGARGAPVHSVY